MTSGHIFADISFPVFAHLQINVSTAMSFPLYPGAVYPLLIHVLHMTQLPFLDICIAYDTAALS